MKHIFIIFLDIDGVLNKHGALKSHPDDNFDREMMDLFNQILDSDPDIKIVIISDWLKESSLKKVTSDMVRNGFRHSDRVIDRISKEIPSRLEDISRWMDDNSTEDFVILDDKDPGFPVGKTWDTIKSKHWVQTKSHVGLTLNIQKSLIQRIKDR